MSGVNKVLRAGRSLRTEHTPSSFSSSPFWARPSLGISTRGAKIASPVISSQGSKKSLSASLQQTIVVTPEEEKVKKPTGMNDLFPAAIKLLGLQLPPQAARTTTRRMSWTSRAQMIVERGVVGCRSFAMIAVAGSLLGSILCFFEGCFFILESFLVFFTAVAQMLDRGRIIQLLIQAIDMFLVGTALLTFGMSIYIMFIVSNETQRKRFQIDESNIFGPFNLKKLSESMQIRSIREAKSRIGQSVVLILQTGMVEKFRDVPLTSGLDLACFAGTLLCASATVFFLSRLTTQNTSRTF